MRRKIKKVWRKWPLKHITALTIALAIFIVLLDSAIMAAFFEYTRGLGYTGAFIGGLLLPSLFTAAAGAVILFELGQAYDPFGVIMFGTAGAVVSDFIILKFVEGNLMGEVNYLLSKFGGRSTVRQMRRKKNRKLMSIAGFAIVSSPLPDELGISMMGISHLSQFRILLVCALADALGVAAVVAAGFVSLT